MPNYTRTNLYDDIQRDAGSITDIDRIVNRAVRDVISEVDLRSTKRRIYSSPFLSDKQFNYKAPADLKGLALIDVRKIVDRRRTDRLRLVSSAYFDQLKDSNRNLVCIETRDFLDKIRISARLTEDPNQVVLNEMDSLTDNGTWAAVLDASDATIDEDFFVNETGAIKFSMDQSTTTAAAGYIQNSDMDAVDLSDYTNGSIFVSVYIPESVTISYITGFTLRWGSSSTVYFSRQVTTTNESITFQSGWNILRFDIFGATETGSVDDENIDYLRLAVDRSGGKLDATDWRCDYVVARRGVPHEIWYYTKYGWQSSTGTYLENSTAATDLLNADTDEYDLFVEKGKELVAEDLKFFDEAEIYRRRYETKKEAYRIRYPSERMIITEQYYNYMSDPAWDWTDEQGVIR